MIEVLEQYPASTTYNYCLCDHIIDRITITSEAVTFSFPNGFSLLNDKEMIISGSGSVRVIGCSPQEGINCWIIRRRATKQGAKLYGKPVSLSKLSELLEKKKLKIEIFCEMYEQHRLYWKGVLLPSNNLRLSTLVIFESVNDYKIEYSWNLEAN